MIKRKKPYSVSSNGFYIDKDDRKSHWVGHSDLNELDTNDLFERENTIDDIEAEMTEASKINSKTVNSVVAEDEAITADAKASNKIKIYLKKKTQAYKNNEH